MAPGHRPAADWGVPTDPDRLERLERAVAELQRELAALRAERAPGAGASAAAPVLASVPSPVAAPRAAPARPPRVELPPGVPPLPGALTGAPPAPRPLAADALPSERLRAWAGEVGGLLEDRASLETLAGRYGTVAVAALLILMGVGAFLTWAIATFTIGPAARVALGVAAALALAAGGWRLRRVPGSRPFADVLLALALAVVHVDAWAAGPYFALVPAPVALGVAALASAALAALAWRAGQQALFVVGVGGALVAPFVTSAAPGHPFVLPIYGWLVLTGGLAALRRRAAPGAPAADAARVDAPGRWAVAARLLAVGGLAYAVVMLDDAGTAAAIGNPAGLTLPGWSLRQDVPALFALALALAALGLGRAGVAAAPGTTLAHLGTTAVAIAALAVGAGHGAGRLAALALVATAVIAPALRQRAAVARAGGATRELPPGWPTAWLFGRDAGDVAAALLLPLALLGAAVGALPDPASPAGGALAAAWCGLAALAAWGDRRATGVGAAPGARAGTHAAAGGVAALVAVALALDAAPTARAAALSALAVATAWLFARLGERLALLPAAAALVAASAAGWGLLLDRPAWRYLPFVGRASLAAAAVVAAWALVARLAWRPLAASAGAAALPGPALREALVAAAATAFVGWGWVELARVGSPDVAAFLVVGWLALCGLACIAVGRRRRVAASRQAGLGLAFLAALLALARASGFDAVGLRVGSYLLVGGFLLGVGYWYRSGGDAVAADAPPGAPDVPPAPTPAPHG